MYIDIEKESTVEPVEAVSCFNYVHTTEITIQILEWLLEN